MLLFVSLCIYIVCGCMSVLCACVACGDLGCVVVVQCVCVGVCLCLVLFVNEFVCI